MNKKLLAGMIAVMTLSGVSASVNEKEEVASDATLDTRIIVEVNGGLQNLSKSEITSSQDKVMKDIANKVTSNFKLVDRYSVLNNAFVVEVNSNDVEAIRALNSVASVTVDKLHAKQSLDKGSNYSVTFKQPKAVEGEDTEDWRDNISAETMHKPSESADGEGTVIAILDNEFYLRGTHTPEDGDEGKAWNHATFKPLASGVYERFTFDNLTETLVKTDEDGDRLMHASRAENATKGQEGSLYFNNKVPFYYDYGGESTSYGKVGEADFDVSSNLTYHGSHVSSIAAGNADMYKGIAPKAQLACMKVFTTFVADETAEQMGFGTSTGAYDSAILNALEDAITLGVDGINMSLGSDLGDFDGDSISMKTLARLAGENGINTAISAGNAGKYSYSFTGGYGNWTKDMVETGILGSYANSGEATIVASGQPTKIYFENAIQLIDDQGETLKNIAYDDQIVVREGVDETFAGNEHFMIDIIKKSVDGIVSWQYIPGFGTANDYGDLDVKGKVVCVNRGSTSFAEKYNIARDNGASAIIIINNDPTATDFNFRCSFGDDFSPTIPCALALYRDKPVFESLNSGKFKFISKDESTNDLARTISTYSSDGARFDYSLKPDITTPGENIRGAVPPQKKEHRDETPYSTYEYLSGTSMAAPNFAGAQALVTSKAYKTALADNVISAQEKTNIINFRKTVDMRLMSTADPMFDSTINPENGEKNYTSPRMQGAGMVNLSKAYATEQYLEGLDTKGNGIKKSKIQLYNNDKIAKGEIALSFKAYNESSSAQTYKAKVTVMRPAIANNNKVIPDSYHATGEIDDVSKIPGLTYAVYEYSSQEKKDVPVLKTVSANNLKVNDVIKLTKQVKYFKTISDLENNVNEVTMEADLYYYNGTSWQKLPGYDYQSIQDVVIHTFYRDVTIPAKANGTVINLDSETIPQAKRTEILENYPYGCAIEGYVELQQNNETKLSIPYLGFYSGADVNNKNTLTNAPVVEPFEFEKDPSTIYPSDLVNDVAKQLVGKGNVDFGSSWTVGYADTTMDVDTDKVLTNDTNFSKMSGFHKVGVNPATEEYFDNPSNNIYVGNPEKTNTMIIHQFVMRSVKDNFFTIKNSKGEIVYKSVLEDMLFGDKQLYKSHVDATYLSAGYVAHRASAIIPLYNTRTHVPFEDGTYEIEFNYQLAYDSNWVKKSYNFIVDSSAPEITGIEEYKTASGEARVRIDIKDNMICFGEIGLQTADIKFDSSKNTYYIDESKQSIDRIMEDIGVNESGYKRLYLRLVDASYGESRAVIHFFGDSYSNYVIAEGSNLTIADDFYKDGQNISWVNIDWQGIETPVTQTDYITVKTSFDPESFVVEPETTSEGCGGSLVTSSLVATVTALAGGTMLLGKKRKEDKEEK